MSSGKHELEAISVRRAKVADADKVRYRVYTSHSEFIAVIAESALMAVKVSGVKTPYKIMRDLPTDGVAIEAKKMAAVEAKPEQVKLRLNPEEKTELRLTEMAEPVVNGAGQPFVPVGIADLRARSGNRARILPPEMVNQIIEDYKAETMPEPVVAAPEPEPVVEVAEETFIAEPELSPADKITQMANEMGLGEAAPAPEPRAEGELSAEEVERLLNG